MKYLKLTFRLILLACLQIFILSELQLFGYAVPFLYLFFILFLPLSLNRWIVLLLAFALGFTIDIFTGTYGLHAFSATAIAYLRLVLFRITAKQLDEEELETFSFNQLSIFESMKYVLLSSFIFCILFFCLDYFNFSAISRLSLQIVFSTIFTGILIFIYRYLFANIEVENPY